MLTLKAIADWLAGILPGKTVYCGFVDSRDEQCIGVYDRDAGVWRQTISAASTYQEYPAKLLLHWSKSSETCEEAAQAVFLALLANRKTAIDGHALIDIRMERPKPINVGRDDNGIWESVIPITIVYEVNANA